MTVYPISAFFLQQILARGIKGSQSGLAGQKAKHVKTLNLYYSLDVFLKFDYSQLQGGPKPSIIHDWEASIKSTFL